MTTRFYLVRHGEAEATSAGGDRARRLTAEGRRRFEAHARALAPELRLGSIVASPYARAVETAELLAAVTGARVATDAALAAGASTGRGVLLLGRAYGTGVALVGHNPELKDAACHAAGHDVDVPPGTIVAIDDDGRRFAIAFCRPIGAAPRA